MSFALKTIQRKKTIIKHKKIEIEIFLKNLAQGYECNFIIFKSGVFIVIFLCLISLDALWSENVIMI